MNKDNLGSRSAISAREAMAAYEIAEAIEGFADFLQSIAEETYGVDVRFQLSIRAPRRGSFDLQFLYEIAGTTNTILSALGPTNLADFVKQVFELLKHLKGESPKSVQNADHGSVAVQNNYGDIIVVNQPVLNIVVDGPAGRSSEHFARRPLQREADNVEISVNGKVAASADKAAADCFVPIGKGEAISEFISEPYLEIRTVVLEGDGQWRFSDGRNKLAAKIDDIEFLQRVRRGQERFGKGDLLKVRLRSRQERTKGQLRITHLVEKVLDHERPQRGQGTLL